MQMVVATGFVNAMAVRDRFVNALAVRDRQVISIFFAILLVLLSANVLLVPHRDIDESNSELKERRPLLPR